MKMRTTKWFKKDTQLLLTKRPIQTWTCVCVCECGFFFENHAYLLTNKCERTSDGMNAIQKACQLIYSRKTSQNLSHTRRLLSCIFVRFGIIWSTHRVEAHQISFSRSYNAKARCTSSKIIIARFWYCCFYSHSRRRWFLCR